MKPASQIGRALLGAAFVLAASATLAWLTPATISPEWRQRLTGVLIGAVLVAYANAIPKAAITRMRTRCAPAAQQAARRFAGWALVMGGIGYIAASLFAPIGVSSMAAGLAVGASVVVMAVGLRRMARPPEA